MGSPADEAKLAASNLVKCPIEKYRLSGASVCDEGITMSHRKYRALERDCRFQTALTGHKETKAELKKMEQEYKVLADWLEERQRDDERMPSEE